MHTTTTQGANPMTKDARTALDAYMEHHEAVVALLVRITEAIANHDVPGADPEHVNWGHVGSLAHWRSQLQEIADSMFNEGEYAATKGATPMTSYQRVIATITTVEPRHIEVWMRLEHPTLDGLSRDEFRDAVYEAIRAWREAGPGESEELARSFGL
jgi:hypothetical protein